MTHKTDNIFIDPSYRVFNQDKLFDLDELVLNRDDQLRPFHRLREHILAQGRSVNTADFLLSGAGGSGQRGEYFSLGILDNYRKIARDGTAKLKGFIIMEPPVVAPHIYEALPELTSAFEQVYVHNISGDGFSLKGVRLEKLKKFYWPIPYSNALEPYWSQTDRARRIVVINGSHRPRSFQDEQYSIRIAAMVELAEFDAVDLYGQGWARWWGRHTWWSPYWRNRETLMTIYKGTCISKFEVLQRYHFCLCFENMAMSGYITEKLFDCLYAGTIPIYLGAPDINRYVPDNVFIDCRKFGSWQELWEWTQTMTMPQIQAMREAGRTFLNSAQAAPFVNSLTNVINE